jgi:hypothetical protein
LLGQRFLNDLQAIFLPAGDAPAADASLHEVRLLRAKS